MVVHKLISLISLNLRKISQQIVCKLRNTFSEIFTSNGGLVAKL